MIKYLDKVQLFKGDAYYYTRSKIAHSLEEAIEKTTCKDSYGIYRVIIRNRNASGIIAKDYTLNQIDGFDYSAKNAKKRIIYLDKNKSMVLYETCIFTEGVIRYTNIFDYEFIYGNRSDIKIGDTVVDNHGSIFEYGFCNFYNSNRNEIEDYSKEDILNSAFVNDFVVGPMIFDRYGTGWYYPLGLIENI